jgi:hypothetical protein
METKTLIPTISNIDHAMMKASHEFRARDRLARRRAAMEIEADSIRVRLPGWTASDSRGGSGLAHPGR